MLICRLDVTIQTIERIRKQLVEEGLEAVLSRRKYIQNVSRKKLDGDAEAHLIALSCSETPKGYSRWSLRLLADRMVVGLIWRKSNWVSCLASALIDVYPIKKPWQLK